MEAKQLDLQLENLFSTNSVSLISNRTGKKNYIFFTSSIYIFCSPSKQYLLAFILFQLYNLWQNKQSKGMY